MGRAVVAWLGAVGGWGRWVVTRIGGDKYPKLGESKIDTTGAGAGSAPGRGVVLVVGGVVFGVLVGASGGCGLSVRRGGVGWWGRLVVAFLCGVRVWLRRGREIGPPAGQVWPGWGRGWEGGGV